MSAQLGPEPLPKLLRRKEVANKRNLFCPSYELCLDEAIANEWVSWTCAHCLRFELLRQREVGTSVHSA